MLMTLVHRHPRIALPLLALSAVLLIVGTALALR
jgi:hypothetical protein